MTILALPARRPRARPKRHYRRSLVQALLACPMYRPSNSVEAAFGSAVHDAIAEYLNTCRAHGEESRLEDTDRIARAAFYRIPRGIDPGRYGEFADLFGRWVDSHIADLVTLYGVEHFLEVEEDCGYFNGTMDCLRRLDDGDPSEPPTIMAVHDWKSQWPLQPHIFQMRFYAALICRTWETVEEVVTVADHFRRSSPFVQETYSRAECLGWWEDMLYGFRVYLAAPKRVAVGGNQCRRCARRTTCGAALEPWRSMPANDAEAEAAYRERVRLKLAADSIWAGLKAYTDHREPLEIDDQSVGWQLPKERRLVVKDPQAVRDLLNTTHDRRGDVVTFLAVASDQLTDDEIDELHLAGLVRWDEGKLAFKERKAATKGEPPDDEPEPVPAGLDTDTGDQA